MGDDISRHETTAKRSQKATGRRLKGAIANRLGASILSGEYAPGEILTNQLEFSESLDVSRTAFREAIQVLSAKGLVESRPKIGTRVLPRERWNLLDPDVLAWAFAGEPDLDFIRSLFELRAIVEPAAAALAAQRRTRAELRTMRDALAEMSRHSLGNEAGRAADREFHDTILAATRNPALVVLSSSIGAAVSWTTKFKQRQRALPRNPIPDHRRVLDAIAAGEADQAQEAMRALIDLALEDTRLSIAPRTDALSSSTTCRPRRAPQSP